jgi:phosphoglycerol transferase
MLNTKLNAKKILYVFFTLALVACVFFFIMRGNKFSFYIPWLYGGDAMFTSIIIKSLINTNSFLTNVFLGSPFNGFQMYDFPMDEFANLAIIYIETFFTDNYACILNFFYLLTFLLTALTSLYTCRRLGLNRAFSLFVSVLFVFSPYHFYRGESHLFLSAYYAVPLYTLMALSLFLTPTWKNFVFFTKNDWKKNLFLIIIILFIATSGIYYAFFGCFFILIAGLYRALEEENINPLLKNSLLIGIILLAVLLALSPSIFYHLEHGQNLNVAHRAPSETERYGLKIIQLLLPTQWSGFSFMDSLKNVYNSSSIINENYSASLGLIGSIGFLLLFLPIIGRKIHFFDGKIRVLTLLNLSAILLASVGGFGTVIAYTIFSSIRCYNRISIFILYFSLLGLALMLQKLFIKFFNNQSKLYSWLIMPCMLFFGLYAQVGHYTPPSYASIQKQFQNDEQFVRKIESHLPPKSAIFQLPYFAFPESPPVNNMPAYSYFRGYLHSHQLRWSAGAMKGRPVATWQKTVSEKPLPQLLHEIVIAGFSGITIDRNGYTDHGKVLESELTMLLHQKPLISPMNDLTFFDLRQYAKQLLQNMPSIILLQETKETLQEMSLQMIWSTGFSHIESREDSTWRWSNKTSVLSFTNYLETPTTIQLNFQLATNYRSPSHVTVQTQQWSEKRFSVTNAGTDVELLLTLPPGKTDIIFSTDAIRVNAPNDSREMYFRINNFSTKPVDKATL